MPGAHKGKERSAAIYPNINSAARCARPVSDDVCYQRSKESDVGSLVHAQQSSRSRWRLLQCIQATKSIGKATQWSLKIVRSIAAIIQHVDRGRSLYYKHTDRAVYK